MKEEIDELNIEGQEEFNPNLVRDEIKQKIEQEKKEPLQPGGARLWGGINPDHLEDKGLELFFLFDRDQLRLPEFQARVEEIFEEIKGEKSSDKKNSRKNLLSKMIGEAKLRYEKDQLEQERASDN